MVSENKLIILPSRHPKLRRRKTWQRYELFPELPPSSAYYYMLKIRAKKKVPQGEALGDFYHALHMSS